jgi:hypothetical protein
LPFGVGGSGSVGGGGGVGGRGLSLGNKTRRKGLLVVARTLDDSKALLPLKQKKKEKKLFSYQLYTTD